MSVNIKMTFKESAQFFDRKAVIDAVGRVKAKLLSKMGAFVQRRAKSSMRKAPKNTKRKTYLAQAGKPPRYRNKLLKDFLFFSWDPTAQSVVVGPAKLNGFKQSTPGPQLLESGGNVTFFASRGRKQKSARFNKFPFMVPAMEAEKKNFPDLWAGAIRG